MRKAAALVAAGLVLAGCSSTVQGVASPAGPDGSQTYAGVKDLYDDVVKGGTACDNFEKGADSEVAKETASCDLGGAGDQLVLALAQDAQARDTGLAHVEDSLDTIGLGYCFVVGRGDSGTWWINAGDDVDSCHAIASDLGGRVDESDGS